MCEWCGADMSGLSGDGMVGRKGRGVIRNELVEVISWWIAGRSSHVSPHKLPLLLVRLNKKALLFSFGDIHGLHHALQLAVQHLHKVEGGGGGGSRGGYREGAEVGIGRGKGESGRNIGHQFRGM